MNSVEFEALILKEAFDATGLVAEIRNGRDPGRKRVQALLDGLELLFQDWRRKTTVDRRLGHALFAIAFHIQGELRSSLPSNRWSAELIQEEQYRIYLLIESIFEDIRIS